MTVDIYGLKRPFEADDISYREGAYGRQLAYIEWHTVCRRLNEATEDNWDFRITNSMMIGIDLIVFGELTIPGLGTRGNMGVQRVREGSGEDLIKGAASDCLKKCATLFGVGLDLYGSDEGDPPEPRMRSSNQSETRVTRPGDPPSPKQLAWLKDLLRGRDQQGFDVSAHLLAVENTENNHGWQLNRATASQWIDSLTKLNMIPDAPEELIAEELVPKAEGASDGEFTPELRARLLQRNEKEKVVWRNIVRSLNKNVATWRELVATATGVMRQADREPSDEVWRFILLAEEAPLNGAVIDGIATVADRCQATNQEFDAVILRRFQEIG